MASRSVHTTCGQQDPLALLKAKVPTEYQKGAVIYSELKQTGDLHVIVHGRVKVSRGTGGRFVVIDLYGRDEFFGECGLLEMERLPEVAVALETTEVMRWAKREIEELVLDRPELGVALMQTLARRAIDFAARLQHCLAEQTSGRLLQSLVCCSERSGAVGDAGSVHLSPLSHQLLAEYTGTTREAVTQHMNEFRRQGLLNYSRKGIILTRRAFEVAALGANRAARPTTGALDGAAG